MQRIWADFNRLRTMPDPNVIPLGPDDAANLAGHTLQDGEQAIFYEEDSLEAVGTLKAVQVNGKRYWVAIIDMSTLAHLNDVPQMQRQAS